MAQTFGISPQDVRRIGAMLTWFESTGHGVILPHRRQPRWWPATPHWGKVTTAWSADTPNEITVNPCKQDGSAPETAKAITVYLTTPTDNTPDGADLAVDDVIAYFQFHDVTNDDSRGIMLGLANEGTHATPYEMLPAAGNRVSELDAQVDTWARNAQPEGKDGVLWHGPRVVYDTENQKYYLFDRVATYDSIGGLASYAAETKREIIDLVNCTEV